jgi:hypothetical protein
VVRAPFWPWSERSLVQRVRPAGGPRSGCSVRGLSMGRRVRGTLKTGTVGPWRTR